MKVLKIETPLGEFETIMYYEAHRVCKRQVPESILQTVLTNSAIVLWQGFTFSPGKVEHTALPRSPITMGEHMELKEQRLQHEHFLNAMQHESDLEEGHYQ